MATDILETIPGLGHNQGPPLTPEDVTARLGIDYGTVSKQVDQLMVDFAEAPEVVEDESQLGIVARLAKRLKDCASALESHREKEKAPYLRAGQAVDAFFAILRDKCSFSSRAKPGAFQILMARIDAYQQRKLAEERARRQREAQEAARKEAEARAESARKAAEAEAARIAAERARKPEMVEAKKEVANEAATGADIAAVDALMARDVAEDAALAAQARSADLVRTRVDSGPLVTMARKSYAEIDDDTLLDKEALWPFIALAAKEVALRQWARTTGHAKPMAGATIGSRDGTVVK